jgi:hypothetical protein
MPHIHWVPRGTGTLKDRDEVLGTMLFETLQVVGITEVVRTAIRLRKKPMKCVCDSEEPLSVSVGWVPV